MRKIDLIRVKQIANDIENGIRNLELAIDELECHPVKQGIIQDTKSTARNYLQFLTKDIERFVKLHNIIKANADFAQLKEIEIEDDLRSSLNHVHKFNEDLGPVLTMEKYTKCSADIIFHLGTVKFGLSSYVASQQGKLVGSKTSPPKAAQNPKDSLTPFASRLLRGATESQKGTEA